MTSFEGNLRLRSDARSEVFTAIKIQVAVFYNTTTRRHNPEGRDLNLNKQSKT